LFVLVFVLQVIFNENLAGLDNHDITSECHVERKNPFDNVHYGAGRPIVRFPPVAEPFWRPGKHFDLPGKLNLDPNSPLCRVSAFVLLAFIALLIDLVFYLLPIWKRWFILSRAEALFLLIPLQGMIVWIARAFFLFPCTPAVFVILSFAAVKFLLMIKYRFASSAAGDSRDSKLIQHVISGCGIISFIIVFSAIRQGLIDNYGFEQHLVWVIFAVPILIHISGLLNAPFYPKGALLISVSQFFAYYLLKPFSPDLPAPFFFLVISLMPWAAAAAVHAAGRDRGKPFVSIFLMIAACVTITGAVEFSIRSIWYLNRQFSYRPRIADIRWDIEKHTDHFNNHDDMEFFVPDSGDRGIRHRMKKPSGVYRIACLGSSSTWGTGSSGGGPRDAYPGRLEDYLKGETGRPVEVVNCGIGGAPIYMLEVFLGEVILPYLDPDLVILYFGANGDTRASRSYLTRLKAKSAEAPFIQSNEEIWAALQLRFVTPITVRTFLSLSKFRIMSVILACLEPLYREPGNAELTPMIGDELYQSPQNIVRFCREYGKKIVLIPEYAAGDYDSTKIRHPYYDIYHDIAAKSQDENVHCLRIDRFFSPGIDRAFFFIENNETDVHMNDDGYSFLAEKIGTLLLAEGIIDPHPAAKEIPPPPSTPVPF